jgi:endonuclease/exonuclease/phosphatase (EEP) superfamily protein YafD
MLAIYPLAVFLLVGLTSIAPQRAGPLALVPIIAPHLLLTTLLLVPIAILARLPVLTILVALCMLLTVVKLGDEWTSWPGDGSSAGSLHLVSWNLQLGARAPSDAVAALQAQDAQIVALQELTDDVSAAIAEDPVLRQRFPYRVLAPQRGVLGLGLLSSFPISRHLLQDDPVSLTAQLTLDEGRRLLVMNAHPLPGIVRPLSFNGRLRDDGLQRLRERAEPLLAGETPLILIGDLNVASSEPSYGLISAGFRDAHREVGWGPGWTWRPESLIRLGLGILRIDYVLCSPSITPRSVAVDCSRRGDHCLVRASVDVP